MKPSELRPEHVGRTVTVTQVLTAKLEALDGAEAKTRYFRVFGIRYPIEDRVPGITLDVELARPAVPTGLGAVARLDGPVGILVVRNDDGQYDDPDPWRDRANGGLWYSDSEIAGRIDSVLSEGIHP